MARRGFPIVNGGPCRAAASAGRMARRAL